MRFARSSGVLCHPTSFPGRFGIGDLGQGAYEFVDWLATAHQALWQVLPLGPTGYADSPYQSFSAFAGNPLLISPDVLVGADLLPAKALADVPPFPGGRVDFGAVIPYKQRLLRLSYERFRGRIDVDQRRAFEAFQAENARWLPDFGLFMAIKAHLGGGSWQDWPLEVATRRPEALQHFRDLLGDDALYHEYVQWLFFQQWRALKQYANQRGIRIIGDIPIFVAEDSADVWAWPEVFKLDEHHRPTVIAGVPPDNFTATGQRWGNPHYHWERMARGGYAWWVDRIRSTLQVVDVLRIDHFRGFEAAWEVPASEPTAMVGEWVKGPNAALFEAVQRELGELPIIAEDLGVITREVDALRHRFDFPGMKILQFGFALDNNPKYLPHSFERNYVVYPGTHDNNTVIGWFNEAKRTPQEKWNCLRYFNSDGHDLAWDFIRAAWASVADMAVAQLQDIMSLGNEARINYPGTTGGNWQWRYQPEMLTDALRARLAELTLIYDRQDKATPGSEGRAGAA